MRSDGTAIIKQTMNTIIFGQKVHVCTNDRMTLHRLFMIYKLCLCVNRKKMQEEEEAKERLRNQTPVVSIC